MEGTTEHCALKFLTDHLAHPPVILCLISADWDTFGSTSGSEAETVERPLYVDCGPLDTQNDQCWSPDVFVRLVLPHKCIPDVRNILVSDKAGDKYSNLWYLSCEQVTILFVVAFQSTPDITKSCCLARMCSRSQFDVLHLPYMCSSWLLGDTASIVLSPFQAWQLILSVGRNSCCLSMLQKSNLKRKNLSE